MYKYLENFISSVSEINAFPSKSDVQKLSAV